MFNNMRYLHLFLGSRSRPYYPHALEVPTHVRTTMVDRRLGAMDHFLESRRFAALIYVNVVLSHLPILFATTTVRDSKEQLIAHYLQSELTCVEGIGVEPKPNQVAWVLWMGAVFAQGDDEVDWFAQRIAKWCRVTAIKTWLEMEYQLYKICWRAKLRTRACRKVWERVEEMNRGFGDGAI